MRAPRNIDTERRNKPPHRKSDRHLNSKRDWPPKTGQPSDGPRGKGELILLVDDEDTILRISKLVLEDANYRVLSANDGAKAIAIFAEQMHAIDAVVTDIVMPHNGVTLIRTIQRTRPDMIFVAVTGSAEPVHFAELEQLGVKNFLMKPYSIDNLLQTLRDALEKRPTGVPE